MTTPVATELTRRGWDTWNIEYRRVGHGSWHDTLTDCAAAIDHITVLADQHGLDPDRVFLLGHSAGGHLAAWSAGRAAVADRTARATPQITVTGLVTAAGALDLAASAHARTGDDAVQQFLGGPPDTVPDRYTAADPMERLPTNIPTRCVHSRTDERVPFSSSERYVTAGTAAGDNIRLLETTGTHTDVIDVDSPAFEVIAAALDELSQ